MNNDLLHQLTAANIVKANGKINSNWRAIASAELLNAINLEMQKFEVSSLSEVVCCLKHGGKRPVCKTCGNLTRFLSYGYYRTYCSAKCAAANESTKQKRVSTNIKKYGVENVAQTIDVREKQSITARRSFTNRMSEQIGDSFLFDTQLLNSADKFNFVCTKCGTATQWRVFAKRIPRCYKCEPHAQSKPHVIIRQMLEELNLSFSEHNREVIKPFEVDFYLPDFKLAIEVNGIFWHSEENGKHKSSHQNKTLLCLQNGITLIHLFEDEIMLNLNQIKSKLIENYLSATSKDIDLEGILEVDGCWPLPQWFSVEILTASEPQRRQINPAFSKQQLTLWDSGKLFYRKRK